MKDRFVEFDCESDFSSLERRLGPADPKRGVRFIKDILRTGAWGADASRRWAVTPQTLEHIRSEYERAYAQGVRSSFHWGKPVRHEGGQHDIDAQSTIADIEKLIVDGDTLYAIGYTDKPTFEAISNKRLKVSVGIKGEFPDGHGNTYSDFLHHVAFVVHPVIPGQQPARELALDNAKQMGSINRLLSALGIDPIPVDGDVEASINDRVAALEKPEMSKELMDAVAAMTAAVTALTTKVGVVDDKLLAIEKQAKEDRDLAAKAVVATRKAGFEKVVKEAFDAQRIDKAGSDRLLALGVTTEYDETLLALIPAESKADGSKQKTPAGGGKATRKVFNPFTGEERELAVTSADDFKAGFKDVRIDDLILSN